ncbi:MAG: hypothetical protein QNJ51_11295, partial [Calothrix sp. MO_167.B12]|nr:hypothetical protein [Calothrix sp. MO_167.B12]
TACADTRGSSFVATGRGGIPQNPNQDIKSDRTWYDIRDLSAYRQNQPVAAKVPKAAETLVEATSWQRNPDGKVELVADKSQTPGSLPQQATCSVAKM